MLPVQLQTVSVKLNLTNTMNLSETCYVVSVLSVVYANWSLTLTVHAVEV